MAAVVPVAQREVAQLEKTSDIWKRAMLEVRSTDTVVALDMVTYATEVLGLTLWQKQIDIMEALVQHRRVAVKSCHGSGKTFAAAAAVIAFLQTHPGSKIITTAQSDRSVREILWQEIRNMSAKAPGFIRGKPQMQRWEIEPNWFALGYKPGDRNIGGFQGFHAEHILLVVDEAAEVASGVYDGLNALMTSESANMLLIGNPVTPSGPFYDAFTKNRSQWHTITIRADDTPNLQSGRVVVPALITQAWVDEMVAEHGPESDFVNSRIHAEFPRKGGNAFIPLDAIDHALEDDRPPDLTMPLEYGLDIARMGEDKTVLVARQGDYVHSCHVWQGVDLMETVARVTRIVKQQVGDLQAGSARMLKVDIGGLGAGVFDRFMELRNNSVLPVDQVIDVNFGGRPNEPEKFRMIRDELWWVLRDRFVNQQIRGMIDPIFVEQVTSIQARYDSSHTHPQIESKDAYRKRYKGSPDIADAYGLAFWNRGETFSGAEAVTHGLDIDMDDLTARGGYTFSVNR